MSEEVKTFDEVVESILNNDSRYSREAYVFVQLALDFYREKIGKDETLTHITGPELLSGVRGLAYEQYGPLARTVLNHWGLKRGEDVGEVVYNLIEYKLMSQSENDLKEDFHGVMFFDDSMDQDYKW
ncbi:MAG: hypothetical protein HKN21_08730 [Candidatus Eisenbacteria bacterium]|uniref:Uncharacterized protein n=1 Tax=Eiseniibacteriota bacterium TaxID=2212470 RepID=A0A7Y2H2M3_UNCEI|nr:hypothetical protein [Candidatus Eisenbacteria bacterium]